MRTAIIFIALCIASTMAVRTEKNFLQLNNNPYVKDMLAQLQGTALGRSVSTLITLKMRVAATKTEYDPEFFSGLFSALDDLRVWLENQRESNVVLMGSRTDQNTQLVANWNGFLTERNSFVTASNIQLAEWQTIIDGKEGLVSANDNSIANFGLVQNTMTVTRTSNNDRYNIDRPRIVAAIEGCNAALTCLEDLEAAQETADASDSTNSTELIQTSSTAEKLLNHLQEASNAIGEVSGLKSQQRIFTMLVTLAQEHTDQAALAKVVTLIEDLRAQLIARLALLDGTEANEIEQYEAQMTVLQDQIDALVTENEGYQAVIDTYTGKYERLEVLRDDAVTEAGILSGNIEGENTSYEAYIVDFNSNQAQIEVELGVLDSCETVLSQQGIERAF